MKSIKKRFKLLLTDIEEVVGELQLLSSDLPLLTDIEQLSDKAMQACLSLRRQTADLPKADFRAGIAEAEALSQLEEIADTDVISLLEERFFTALQGQTESPAGDFLQHLLVKIDRRYTTLAELIQKLTTLPNEE